MKTFLPEKWENAPSKEAVSPAAGNNKGYPAYNNNKPNGSEETRAKVERVVALIEQGKVDITAGYDAWLKVGFALSSEFGEAGRGFFHRVSKQNTKYSQGEADRQYNKCLTGKGDGVTIATFFQMAKDAGVDISSPKIQNHANGSLDFWTFGSPDKREKPKDAPLSPVNAPEEIQKSKTTPIGAG